MPIVGLQSGQDAELAKLAIRHFERDLVIERTPSNIGSYSDDDGRYYKPEPELFNTKGVVEPISSLRDRDLRELSEGERIEAQIVVWTESNLFSSDSQGIDNHEGISDVIHYRGERWKVIKIQRREEGAYFVRVICGLYQDRDGEKHASSGQVISL